MILVSSVWIILAPLIAAQYILATVGLIMLSHRDIPTKNYVIWNLVILLVFFVGTITFLIYDRIRPRPKNNI